MQGNAELEDVEEECAGLGMLRHVERIGDRKGIDLVVGFAWVQSMKGRQDQLYI